jgi:hypothetical protein
MLALTLVVSGGPFSSISSLVKTRSPRKGRYARILDLI